MGLIFSDPLHRRRSCKMNMGRVRGGKPHFNSIFFPTLSDSLCRRGYERSSLIVLTPNRKENPLGVNRNFDKLKFHPYFTTKDLFGFFALLLFLRLISLIRPWILGDPENFIPANPLVTPVHIQPEW